MHTNPSPGNYITKLYYEYVDILKGEFKMFVFKHIIIITKVQIYMDLKFKNMYLICICFYPNMILKMQDM